MDHRYNPNAIEANWSPVWEEQGFAAPTGHGTPYCIMIPPPNVTGSLHMGHGFQLSLMDGLIRYHRMQGCNTLWQVGTDHAGIATQMVVERNLSAQGVTRKELGREAFLEKVWEWKQSSGSTITQQMRRMGASVDWQRERFTMDTAMSKAVCTQFVRMHRDGLIYRGKRLVNWDPKLQTAISDLEIVNEERNGNLWHIRYALSDGSGFCVVATTRPETLFGDVAVAVHPDDSRYQHLVGKTLKLPLTDKHIPIIQDDYVDPEYGSGCVKITPAHDFNDYQVGKRHGFNPVNIFQKDARLNTNVPATYQGLSREDARVAVLKALKAQLLLETTKPHRHAVPIGDRSGVVIEPYLTDQWFVQCDNLAQQALDCVAKGDITFYPHNTVNTYNRWLENIEDWCISRQLWWGHRIPAWFDSDGNSYVGHSEAEVRTHYSLPETLTLSQDEDVLDTWFSSALWPFATLGWPNQSNDFSTFFPTQVLVTGHDILFFWVARMIMLSLYSTGTVPFKHVVVTGLIRDENNDKMSKSKGNIIDPLDLIQGTTLDDLIKKRTSGLMMPEKAAAIEKNTRKLFPKGMQAYGTDALRFTFFALATTGRDVRFDVNRLEGYRNFCNKLWNAARFVLNEINARSFKPTSLTINAQLATHNRWIIEKLDQAITQTHHHFQQYRFDLLAKDLYEFVWTDVCDWYIELAKYPLKSSYPTASETLNTLFHVLERTLRLLHPVIPYITEELWQAFKVHLTCPKESIMLASFPSTTSHPLKEQQEEHALWQQAGLTALSQLSWMQALISAVRSMRSEMHISPARTVPLIISGGGDYDTHMLTQYEAWICELAKCHTPERVQKNTALPPSACMQVTYQVPSNVHEHTPDHTPSLSVHIPLEGLINVEDELQRATKIAQKCEKQLSALLKREQSPSYRERAPKEVLEENDALREDLRNRIAHYKNHLAALRKLQTESSDH